MSPWSRLSPRFTSCSKRFPGSLPNQPPQTCQSGKHRACQTSLISLDRGREACGSQNGLLVAHWFSVQIIDFYGFYIIPMSYRDDIDGLRALAVLGVILFHAGVSVISGGFVGVDIFFVISGYLITGLLLNEARMTGRVQLAAFFTRRVRRLLPAMVLVVGTTLLLGWVFLFPEELPRLGKSATAVSLISANVHFMHYSGGYFDPSTDLMPLLHMWSLAVEEQYYLAWPLLFLLALRLTRGWKAGFSVSAEGLLVVVLVGSFLAACYWVRLDQPSAFYLMPLRAWEFAAGGLLHWLIPKLQTLRAQKTLALILAAAGVSLMLGSFVLMDDQMRFPAEQALWPVGGAALFILGGSLAPNPVSGLFATRPLVNIGKVSYSWYLWHWPLLAICRSYYLGERLLARDTMMVALALVLAVLTYRHVEQPIRLRHPGWLATNRGSLVVGGLLSLFVIASASTLVEIGKRSSPPQEQVERGALGLSHIALCKEYDDGHLSPVPSCLIGDNKKAPELAVWGDSHAGHYLPMLSSLALSESMSIVVRKHGGCPPLTGVVPYKKGDYRENCRLFSKAIQREMPALSGTLKGVILSARWGAYISLPPSDPGGFHAIGLLTQAARAHYGESLSVGQPPLDMRGSLAALRSGLFATLDLLKSRNVRVLIVAPTPEMPFNVPQCLRRRPAEECVISRAKVEQRRAPILSILHEAEARYPNVRVWDSINQFCDKETCQVARSGKSLYFDDDHISPYMALSLQDTFRSRLHWLLGLTE